MLYRQSLAAQVGRDQKQLGEDVEAARREAAERSAAAHAERQAILAGESPFREFDPMCWDPKQRSGAV